MNKAEQVFEKLALTTNTIIKSIINRAGQYSSKAKDLGEFGLNYAKHSDPKSMAKIIKPGTEEHLGGQAAIRAIQKLVPKAKTQPKAVQKYIGKNLDNASDLLSKVVIPKQMAFDEARKIRRATAEAKGKFLGKSEGKRYTEHNKDLLNSIIQYLK